MVKLDPKRCVMEIGGMLIKTTCPECSATIDRTVEDYIDPRLDQLYEVVLVCVSCGIEFERALKFELSAFIVR